MQITTTGLDLAKSVFQVHGIDAAGQAVVRKSAVITSIRAPLQSSAKRSHRTAVLWLIRATNGVPAVGRACLALRLAVSCSVSRGRFWSLIECSWPGTGPTRRASAFITFPGSVPCWRPLWLRVLLTPGSWSGRNFSAWIGLVPRQHLSGGKERLGSISKQDDRYLLSLFVAGALAVIRCQDPWRRTSALAHGVVRSTPGEGCRLFCPSDVGGLIPSCRLGRPRLFLDRACRQLQHGSPLPRSEVSDKDDCTV
jgi:hypothetical protein